MYEVEPESQRMCVTMCQQEDVYMCNVSMHVFMCACMYACMHACMHVSMCVCVCLCVCVCVYIVYGCVCV